jgi:hypothetical protein
MTSAPRPFGPTGAAAGVPVTAHVVAATAFEHARQRIDTTTRLAPARPPRRVTLGETAVRRWWRRGVTVRAASVRGGSASAGSVGSLGS